MFAMIIVSAIFLLFSTILFRKRKQRLIDQRLRWKQIKELEEDYDVYISDEYAYHITDTRRLSHNINNIEFLGTHGSNNHHMSINGLYHNSREANNHITTAINQSRRTGSLSQSSIDDLDVLTLNRSQTDFFKGNGLINRSSHNRLLSLRSEAASFGKGIR